MQTANFKRLLHTIMGAPLIASALATEQPEVTININKRSFAPEGDDGCCGYCEFARRAQSRGRSAWRQSTNVSALTLGHRLNLPPMEREGLSSTEVRQYGISPTSFGTETSRSARAWLRGQPPCPTCEIGDLLRDQAGSVWADNGGRAGRKKSWTKETNSAPEETNSAPKETNIAPKETNSAPKVNTFFSKVCELIFASPHVPARVYAVGRQRSSDTVT